MMINSILTHEPRPPYHHGDLARALLKSADEIIEAEGLEAFTLRSCARRAGVSHAAPAHHFGDRAGLLSAYAASVFRDLTLSIKTHVAEAGEDPYEKLKGVGLAYIRFAIARPGAFRLVFSCEALHQEHEELKEAGDSGFQVLVNVVAAIIPGKDPDTVLSYSLLAWSIVHGFANLWLEGNFAHAMKRHNLEPCAHADALATQILTIVKPAFVQSSC